MHSLNLHFHSVEQLYRPYLLSPHLAFDFPPCSLCISSRSEPCRAPAVVEGCDRRQRSWHGGQRHQTQQWHWYRRGWRRRSRPLHQQLFFNYLLLQSCQSITAYLSPFHRQRTVPRPQPQKREGKGAGKRAREVKKKKKITEVSSTYLFDIAHRVDEKSMAECLLPVTQACLSLCHKAVQEHITSTVFVLI